MKILALKDVIRKDVPIYYRRLYTGVAAIELTNAPVNYRIDFTIETKPTGNKEISVVFIDKVDYPLVPLNHELKAFIDNLDDAGGLPD